MGNLASPGRVSSSGLRVVEKKESTPVLESCQAAGPQGHDRCDCLRISQDAESPPVPLCYKPRSSETWPGNRSHVLRASAPCLGQARGEAREPSAVWAAVKQSC